MASAGSATSTRRAQLVSALTVWLRSTIHMLPAHTAQMRGRQPSEPGGAMARKRTSETSITAAPRATSSPGQSAGEGNDDASISKPSPGAQSRSAAATGLVIVATPIGNAGDITLRALELLRRADCIACEDTRVTGGLMARYGITTPLLPYHDHNAARMRPALLERLRRGQTVAFG